MRVAAHDLGQLFDGIEAQMLAVTEPLPEWAGQHPGPGRGADQRERFERHVERPRVDPLAQDDVDAKILHRRIEKFLDRLGECDGFRR